MLTFTVTKCYEIITPESAEEGDVEERGFIYKDLEMDLDEVMRELAPCTGLSDYPDVSSRTWAINDVADCNYRTGAVTGESIHISQINGHPISAHQLKRLYKAAGLIK